MQLQAEQARRFAELLANGKAIEALSTDYTCQFCSRKFEFAQGAMQQGERLFKLVQGTLQQGEQVVIICPHCRKAVFNFKVE